MTECNDTPEPFQNNLDLPVCERVIAGIAWKMVYQGAAQELKVLSPLAINLPVWRYRQHREALKYSLQATPEGLRLDSQRLVNFVLGEELTTEQQQQLTPLVLWWISGADGLAVEQDERQLVMETGTVSLKPWSEQQRVTALQACLVHDPLNTAVESRLDPVSYLHAMVQATAYELTAAALDNLDAAQTQALLQAVTRLNMPAINQSVEPTETSIPPAIAARTLRLCKALGWTPAKVWATPAVEVDRLLALLKQTEPQSFVSTMRPVRRKQRLADAPDAIVIQVEDDE